MKFLQPPPVRGKLAKRFTLALNLSFGKTAFLLPQLIGHAPHSPSLLHGDLWSGNVIPNENRQAVLIDPAVYYGDREAEIAYTELFGGFSRKFYQAYLESWPLDKGYKDRRDLYNVYHLMNHLNLFGEAYGSQLDAILRYYVG